MILCDIVGSRAETAAVPVLLHYLNDPSSGVRGAAADALGSIGDPASGPVLFAHFTNPQEEKPVLHLLAVALGVVGYRPAIPSLIHALGDPDHVLRGCAAWSLGELRALDAEPALRLAISQETDTGYPMERMQEALAAIVQSSGISSM